MCFRGVGLQRRSKGVMHRVHGPRGARYSAKCDVAVDDLTAVLDYEPYPAFNEAQGMLPGITRLHFADADRKKIVRVEWKAKGTARFVSCVFESRGLHLPPVLPRNPPSASPIPPPPPPKPKPPNSWPADLPSQATALRHAPSTLGQARHDVGRYLPAQVP